MTREAVPGSDTVCTRCGQRLVLVPWGMHYKYVLASGDRQAWKCDPTPEYPVRSHIPKEKVRHPE